MSREIQTLFNEYSNAIFPLPDSIVDEFFSITNIVTYKKQENIIEHQSLNNYEYIVMEGVCRIYILDYEGNEATLAFYIQGNVLPPNQIRTVNGKSLYTLQALTDIVLARFNSNAFADFMRKYSEVEKWGLSVFNNELKSKVNKEIDLITLPAKERLNEFRKKYSGLENIIPHPYIASYLGISPVSLSRLRGKKQ